jgi:hypothetical protein
MHLQGSVEITVVIETAAECIQAGLMHSAAISIVIAIELERRCA